MAWKFKDPKTVLTLAGIGRVDASNLDDGLALKVINLNPTLGHPKKGILINDQAKPPKVKKTKSKSEKDA